MKLHANAKLTVHQRVRVRREHWEQGVSQRVLATRYGVNRTTIQRWVHRADPHDRPPGPRRDAAEADDPDDALAGAIAHRQAHPHYGTLRIVQERRRRGLASPTATTLWRKLRRRGLVGPRPRRPRTRRPIPTGRHRVQMDCQQLPAVAGDKGFAYKIAVIHTRTRCKYSEIHDNRRSGTVAGVLRRAVGKLPPFFLIWTDNAMEFTMAYSFHRQRRTAFEKQAAALGLIHGRSRRGCPWQNGFVERSNRSDNDELFDQERFDDAEHRRYRLWLWEAYYNHQRPHQSLGGRSPMDRFQQEYPLHASARMLTG
jgi:transposase InsO family protein